MWDWTSFLRGACLGASLVLIAWYWAIFGPLKEEAEG